MKCPLSVGVLYRRKAGVIMAKVKKKLNLKNPKQLVILYRFSLAEGRLAKDEIIKTGNKEIFYTMKNNGYIRETQKGSGVFKATAKLKTLTEKTTGIAYGNGCSSKHSEKINHQINRIPDTVLLEGRFESGKMLRYEMETVKQSHKYTRAIEKLRNKSLQEERKLRNDYQQFMQEYHTQAEKYQAYIDYQAQARDAELKREIACSDTPLFIPDFKVSATREETELILQDMKQRRKGLQLGSREYAFLEQNEGKLMQMLQVKQEVYELYFEVVTNSYGKAELERHHNYETVLEREVLYIT